MTTQDKRKGYRRVGDTSSCNGSISGRFGPTEEALIRTNPNLIHSQTPLMLLMQPTKALIYGEVHVLQAPWARGYLEKARSSYSSSFLARLPHTSHFLNCPTLQTSSLRRLAKNLKPRFQPLYCTLIPFLSLHMWSCAYFLVFDVKYVAHFWKLILTLPFNSCLRCQEVIQLWTNFSHFLTTP